MDPRAQHMATVLVNYCLGVRPGWWVLIWSHLPGEPLVVACTEEILRAGANPSVLFNSEENQEAFLREANDEQLRFLDPMGRVGIEQADALINIRATGNSRTLSSVDPARIALREKAREPLIETYMSRFIDDYRLTITEFPTNGSAQDAGMSLRQYEDFVYGAALLNEPDPVTAWADLGRRLNHLVEWLKDKSEVHITGEGTDLRVGVGGRTWVADDGHLNFPGGEVFTGPREDGVEGTVTFNTPGYYQGNEVSGVRLRYEAGKVVDATATANEAFLHRMLEMDDGARRLGEFAFGANPNIQKFTRNVLFDEKIGGTLHMALGRSIPQTRGENMSALHWDMVYDLRGGAEVTVDGRLFSRGGQFQV
ncbi:MAG: aminopeptidase [Chloroflexota bacterium]